MKPQFQKLTLALIALIIIGFTKINAQCNEFYGMTSGDGGYGTGTIFKTDDNGNNFSIVNNLDITNIGASPRGGLCKANNGKIYGVTSDGGIFGRGVIFEWDPESNTYTNKFDFNGSENGGVPMGSLIQATNGKLYGMTVFGGAHDFGVLYEWDLTTDTYAKKLDFNGTENGGYPSGSLVQADNGKLYGMADFGAVIKGSFPKGCGVLFEWDPVTDTYTKKLDFNGTSGSIPGFCSLMKASNGKLYGMTESGGLYQYGVLFEWDPVTNIYNKKLDFNGNQNGGYPYGSLMQANNGKLYGITTYGGTGGGGGILFEWDPITNTYTDKFNFSGHPFGANGKEPSGSLMQANNGKLYGMTREGGIYNYGVLFEWDPTANTFAKKLDFDRAENGSPFNSYLIQFADGMLYGIALAGGANGGGVLFKWDPNMDTYTKKLDFNWAKNGRNPEGSLMQADNGKLYGMTSGGGVMGHGVLFELDPVTNTYSKELDFKGTENGRKPHGSLMQANNGKLYGMTYEGGIYNYGVLFEWDPVTKIYIKKLDFDGSNNGRYPYGCSLLQAKNGKLYGMTAYGGEYGDGVLFEWDPVADTYTKKLDFNKSENGMWPMGSLTQASDGKLYGMTSCGGLNGVGVIFEWDIVTDTYTKKVDFSNNEKGCSPYGSLIQTDNEKLYGMTSLGGEYGCGVLFEWDPFTNIYIKKLDFNGAENGNKPKGSLIQAGNSKLYGMTSKGGANDNGVLFEWDPLTSACSKKIDFDGENGLDFFGSLIEVYKPSISINVCACESYTSPSGKYVWTSTGIYIDTVPNSIVCDSIITVYLTINNSTTSTISPTACSNYTSPSGLHTWTSSGTYLDTIPNAAGCDSIITISLTVHESSSSILNETACDKYNFNGNLLYTSGTYHDTIPNAMGCDSCITMNLTILESSLNILEDTACSEYNFNGRILKTSGTYFDIFPNAAGCDSIIVLYLTILEPTSSTIFETACDRFIFGGVILTASGVYYDTVPNAVGCDSTIILDLRILKSTTSTINPIACDSYTSPSGNYIWTSSGTYTDTIPNSAGCDSIIAVEITILNSTTSTISPTACDSYISPSGLYKWTSSGTYLDSIPNNAGCDSIISVELTILNSTTSSISPFACDSYTSPSGLYIWTSSGTYFDTIPNSAGCDSVITIDLLIDHVDASVIQDRTVLISSDISADHQWIDCDNGYTPIEWETYLTFTAIRAGNYAVIVSHGACVDTSACYFVSVTGLPVNTFNNINLYPNPNTGSFSIDLGKVVAKTEVTIAELDGRIIQKEEFNNARILPLKMVVQPGLYLVSITSENERAVLRIVKK